MSKKSNHRKSSASHASTPDANEQPAVELSPEMKALIGRLQDSVVERAVKAIEELTATNSPAAVLPLIEVVQNPDHVFHSVTRATAAMALGKLGCNEAVATLTAATQDSSFAVSSEAILALGELRAKPAIGMLMTIVQNANGFYSEITRFAALRALGRIGDAAARQILAETAGRTTESAAIATAACEALTNL